MSLLGILALIVQWLGRRTPSRAQYRDIFTRRCPFTTPLAYVLIFIFLVTINVTFWPGRELIENNKPPSRTSFLLPVGLYAPLLAMRTLADEHRRGTIELISTMPVRTIDSCAESSLGASSCSVPPCSSPSRSGSRSRAWGIRPRPDHIGLHRQPPCRRNLHRGHPRRFSPHPEPGHLRGSIDTDLSPPMHHWI